jgi:hypothetical protein
VPQGNAVDQAHKEEGWIKIEQKYKYKKKKKTSNIEWY